MTQAHALGRAHGAGLGQTSCRAERDPPRAVDPGRRLRGARRRGGQGPLRGGLGARRPDGRPLRAEPLHRTAGGDLAPQAHGPVPGLPSDGHRSRVLARAARRGRREPVQRPRRARRPDGAARAHPGSRDAGGDRDRRADGVRGGRALPRRPDRPPARDDDHRGVRRPAVRAPSTCRRSNAPRRPGPPAGSASGSRSTAGSTPRPPGRRSRPAPTSSWPGPRSITAPTRPPPRGRSGRRSRMSGARNVSPR